ncbi:hypothetical protein C2G38_2166116 [Gigaspora rosea]|uniref:BTB domain-containing protein n=1 Tax=Gigaspora rosea TaxID=44941 RepID=A0A397VS55_9GLOM|nr:hypothetical protein C2G38_2166116 [Gigaspora rosea]
MDNGPIQSFSNLLENPKDFDVKIKVGERPNIKEFKAHSIILIAKSNYFKAALSSRWATKENGIITFDKPNISPPVFEILINYIYTGTFSNNHEVSLLDIFIAADEIGLFEISQQVEKDLRNEALGYLRQGKFLKALKLYEEILKNCPYSAEDQESASKWDLSRFDCSSDEKINELVKVLCKNTTLTSLNLSLNENFGVIKLSGVKALVNTLCKNSTLKDLNLSNHNLGSLGEALADTLRKNSTLTSLNLYKSNLGSKGGKALADALCKNSTLTSLNLAYNYLGSERTALANALDKNSTLTSLNLDYNNLGSKGGKELADALCKNSTLTSLNLAFNNLGSEGGKALAIALCKNVTLTSLKLDYNKLGSEGGKALAYALSKNSTLTSLDLSYNELGSEGGKALAGALSKNSTLTSLNLSYNKLGSKGGKALADALIKNSTLTYLNIKRTFINFTLRSTNLNLKILQCF